MISLLAVLPAAAATPPPVHEFTLDNGMKILVREDHRAPVVVSQVWYKVGSSYEPAGLTGISHVLEHMMFQGTDSLAPGEFSRIIAANGGTENAFTARDYTAYYQQLQKDRLEVSLRLEADRMRNLRLDPDKLAKEIRVVMEERRLRTDDAPEALTQEQFHAVAFVTSPYRNPIIGWMSDLQALTLEDVEGWYRQWYAPNNATLVVVGDVDPQQVLVLAKTHFGPLQPAAPPPLRPRPEIPQRGERQLIVKAPAELPFLLLGYKAPALATAAEDWEPYALEVLGGILSAGASARLDRNLVRGSRVAASAGAGYSLTTRLDSLFILAANPAPGRRVAEVERALRAEVKRLQEEPVSADELARVVAQVVAADVYQRDSMFYQAMRLGVAETNGLGWRVLEEYVPRIQAVTAEQVQAVARKYLVDDQLTVAILEPQPLNGPPRPAAGAADAIVH
ncbi:MAG: insulinase family protein [Pseudomonadota bacterium]|nr:insulinase family protein [Pseudomonadota bacterium]